MQKNSSRDNICCSVCGTKVHWDDMPKHRKDLWHSRKRAYCSDKCRDQFRREVNSRTMRETNLRRAEILSERMKKNNPMHMPGVKEKMIRTLNEMGHKPSIQGGNGKPTPVPQAKLWKALRVHGAVLEHVVSTKSFRNKKNKLAKHYKIDIALPKQMVAIEVDGPSHQSLERQAQDRKKENFLDMIGWTVLRFSNEEVMADTKKCVETVMSTISR